MSSDILVSNGTCYSASGRKLDKSFIPCGNAAYGHQTCCGAGDNCLGDNACFGVHGSGYGSWLTYMAGCTDPDYKDKSCPNKEGIDQPWIALTLCDHTDGIWAACSQQGNPSTLQPGSYCSCTDTAKATIAFTDANQLPNIASLPAATGDTISFFPDHTPSGTPATTTAESPTPVTTRSSNQPTTTEGSSGPASNTGGSASQTSAPPPSPSSGATQPGPSATNPSSTKFQTGTGTPTSSATSQSPNVSSPTSTASSGGLSPGAKAGIAVAAAVAGLIFIAVLVALLLSHRRKRQRQPSVEAAGSAEKQSGIIKHDSLRTSEADGQPVSEADGVAARPWSMRSELEGDQPPVLGTGMGSRAGGAVRRSGEGGDALSPVAELPGSEVDSRDEGGGWG
ncbi:hypothetical protein B0T22DRAFT_528110 [Podospora appendiculata]|uniref:Uncharacterized protein n=1 Tax=Podospora appendiculata TaxID=314037 RepID=A0AAE1CCU0_9PEZI|nr:hypothetical protein B0T22DRAFT_528110 [Podospora appendiculata]